MKYLNHEKAPQNQYFEELLLNKVGVQLNSVVLKMKYPNGIVFLWRKAKAPTSLHDTKLRL